MFSYNCREFNKQCGQLDYKDNSSSKTNRKKHTLGIKTAGILPTFSLQLTSQAPLRQTFQEILFEKMSKWQTLTPATTINHSEFLNKLSMDVKNFKLKRKS